jgi:hypothetical protein
MVQCHALHDFVFRFQPLVMLGTTRIFLLLSRHRIQKMQKYLSACFYLASCKKFVPYEAMYVGNVELQNAFV